eukprot:gene5398-5792_t
MQGLCLEQIRDGMDLEMIDNDDTFIDQLEIYLSPESSNEPLMGDVPRETRCDSPWSMFTCPQEVLSTVSHSLDFHESSERKDDSLPTKIGGNGQKIVKGVDVLNEDLCMYYPRLHEMMVNTIDGRKYPDIVELSGSLVIYVNGYGLIDKMEIFSCQIEQ